MRRQFLCVAAVTVILGGAGIGPALAHGGHDAHRSHGSGGSGAHHEEVALPSTLATGPAVTLQAVLSGANEVPVQGGPAVNDPDGKARALVTVKGDRVIFALRWKGLVPTLGHIHQGNAGVNGGVKVPLFGSAMPDSVHAAAGQVAVTDSKLAQDLRSNPSAFYVNLHSAKFPGGAVRGQLKPLHRPVNPLSIINGGKLRALSDGGQEVPKDEASKVGDPDGHAVTFLRPKGTEVDYSFAWVNLANPVKGHLHNGPFGKNGDVVFDFFNRPVPEGIFAVSGSLVSQDPAAVRRVRSHPENYYSNLHTSEFPDGAVRGQLFR